MKKLVLSASIAMGLSLNMSAHAEEVEMSFCEQFEDLSRSIMDNRQNGIPMSTQYNLVDNELIRKVVVLAYKVPEYSSPEYQEDAVNKFGNAAFMQCIEKIGQ